MEGSTGERTDRNHLAGARNVERYVGSQVQAGLGQPAQADYRAVVQVDGEKCAVGRPGWRRISRGSTGRCGSPRWEAIGAIPGL